MSGYQIILIDEVADVGPAEIVPAEMLQARLHLALFQDLDQHRGDRLFNNFCQFFRQ